MFRRLPLLALLVAALAIAAPVAGQAENSAHPGSGGLDEDSDYDRARDLLEHGEINSLGEIMARLSGEHPGEIVGIALVRSKDRWVYRFKVLTADGELQELSVDAKSMDVIRNEGGD
jgi:uncharacterized membrane protein YkoI